MSVAAAASCDEDPPRNRLAMSALEQPRRAPPRDTGSPSGSAEPPLSSSDEGAPTPELVFARAQKALDDHDYAAFLACIRPSARRRWLTDLVVAVAIDSADERIASSETRRAQAEARRVLARFGATAALEKPEQASAETLGVLLMQKVKDPDGLFAALLAFAEIHGADFDPIAPLHDRPPPSIDARPAPPSAAAFAIVRLASRVRGPGVLGELSRDGDEAVALVLPPGAKGASASASPAAPPPPAPPAPSPSASASAAPPRRDVPPPPLVSTVPRDLPSDAYLPIRFHFENGVVWLDES